MTDTTYHSTETAGRTNPLAAFFAAIWNGLIAMGENSSRYRRLKALSALSDAELAERGIRREDIVRHVFADVYYV